MIGTGAGVPAVGQRKGEIHPMEWEWLSGQVAYLAATRTPLSADVGLVRTEAMLWLYDVGSTPDAAAAINGLPGKKCVVVSHFHPDHMGNLDRVEHGPWYGGAFTCKKGRGGIVVEQDLKTPDGVHLFPLPSVHAKGCVGMEYGNYAFLGDALYPAVKAGQAVYNVSLLAQQLRVLKGLQAEWFLVSHSSPFARKGRQVIARLEELYARRRPGETYLPADSMI